MSDLAAWIAVGVGVAALLISYLSFRRQRNVTRLSYVLTLRTELVPDRVADDLTVSFKGAALKDPSLAIVRIVSTGDQPITANDFETALTVRLSDIDRVVFASCSAARPAELAPVIEVSGSEIRITPMLINPGDMIELQVITEGRAGRAELSGRVRNLEIEDRAGLPYPPGSGEYGELIGFDKFVWYVLTPGLIIGTAVGIALSGDDYTETTRTLIIGAGVIVAVALYPRYVAYLVRRRAMWEPPPPGTSPGE